MGIPLCVICCFSLAAFNMFSLSLIFDSLINMCLGMCLLGFILYGTLCFLDLINYSLSHIRDVFDYNLFKYFLSPFLFLENFPNMGKEIVNQVYEAQRVPYRISPRRNMPRHILIKLPKIKYKENILKAATEKQHQFMIKTLIIVDI